MVAQLEGSLKGGHCEDGKQGVGVGFLGRVLVLQETRGWGRVWCILGFFFFMGFLGHFGHDVFLYIFSVLGFSF